MAACAKATDCNMPDGFQLVPRVESESMENCITVAIRAYIVLHGLSTCCTNRRPTFRHTPRSCEGRMFSVFPGVILIAGDHHHATATPPATVRRPGALSACRDHAQHPHISGGASTC
jgi:hypothetical protein